MMVEKLRLSAIWVVLATLSIVIFLLIQNQWKKNIGQAKQHFIESNHAATVGELSKLETAVRSIYENIRTLATLPSVRDINRHATNMSQEAHVTFQQIYNNLASNVAISEVYIVPIDFAPSRIDPITLKPEQPILMYDELILNSGNGMTIENRIANPNTVAANLAAGPPQIESYEYAQLVDHAAWLKQNFPNSQSVRGLKMPFISGPEVITRDNSLFNKSGQESDRSGIIFSVPFYGSDGKIRGMISAVLLTSALRDLLPLENFALVNPGNQYANLASGAQTMLSSLKYIESGKVDPGLIFSEVLPLSVIDSRSPWSVWSGLPNERFWQGNDVIAANATWRNSLILLGTFLLIATIITLLTDRYLRQSTALAESNIKTRFMAEQSEAEAREIATKFQSLNQDISRLNTELSQKITELTAAQDDIIKKGKLAQLGNLVATVAHELRNPLGAVRTTAFMLRRKLKDSSIDVEAQLQRIDSGVSRCDAIISQLLDFARSQPLTTAETDLEAWLENVVTETSSGLASSIAIKLIYETKGLNAGIESERMRRAMINLLNNAAEALTAKDYVASVAPEIVITLAKSNRGAEIIVQDNGPGMAPDVIEKIGEALFTTKSFGTGLGIAAVRKIAELHGGGLDISSTMGQGARFALWLPIETRHLTAA